MSLDLQIFEAIHALVGKVWLLDGVAAFVAVYLPYILLASAILTIVFTPRLKDKIRLFAYASLAIILSRGIIAPLFYYFLPRLRPFEALGFEPLVIHNSTPAFPSGHATFYVALACAFIFAGRRALGFWLLLGAALICLSRIYAGLHWPGDMAGGFAIGILSAYITHRLLYKYPAVTKV